MNQAEALLRERMKAGHRAEALLRERGAPITVCDLVDEHNSITASIHYTHDSQKMRASAMQLDSGVIIVSVDGVDDDDGVTTEAALYLKPGTAKELYEKLGLVLSGKTDYASKYEGHPDQMQPVTGEGPVIIDDLPAVLP